MLLGSRSSFVLKLDKYIVFSYIFVCDAPSSQQGRPVSKKVKYCVNHPDVVAPDQCVQCENQVCYNCRIVTFGHVFCSIQCIIVFLAKETVSAILQLFQFLFFILFWPFRMIRKLSWRGWVELFLTAGLIVCFVMIWRMAGEIRELHGEGVEEVLSTSDSGNVIPPTVFDPTEGGMVFSNSIDISGEAESNRIVSLSIDGKISRVIIPTGNHFAFNDVRLHRGDNLLEIRAISEEGHVSTLEKLSVRYATPTVEFLARDFQRGSTRRREIALTFDGGSINNAADEILDSLKDSGIECTFFLTGEFMRKYPQTVKRIINEGHEVGNHTWSHPHLTTFAQDRRHRTVSGMSMKKLHEEFTKAASLFQVITGKEMASLWRAPFGEINAEILRWAALAGYRHVGWTVGEQSMDTMDWVADKNSRSYRTADEVVEKIISFARSGGSGANGAIVLMHLGTNRTDDFPHLKLPQIIDGLHKQGYTLVRVSQMMSQG